MKFAKEHNFLHISMGDILRAEIESGSKDSELIKETIEQGGCLPFEFFWGFVERDIRKAGWSRNVFLDGFPRSEQNNEEWWSTQSRKFNFGGLIHFDADEETVTERILKRAETSGRIDDNVEALQKRLKKFSDEQVPMIKRYEEKE